MAWCNLYQSGDTGAINAVAHVEEKSSSGNYRTIQLRVGLVSVDYSGGRDGGYSISCTEAGVDRSNTCSISGTETTILDETFSVYVAPGETHASINLEFSAYLISPSTGRKSIRGGISMIEGLKQISDVTISSAKGVYFGDRCSITWSPPATNFYYKLAFECGVGSTKFTHTTQILHPNTTGAYTFSDLTIPESAAENFPNSTSGPVYVKLFQYSDSGGNTPVGVPATASFTATLRESVVPTLSGVSISADNSLNSVVQSWGIAITGITKIKAMATGRGVYGSTIQAYILSGEYSVEVPIREDQTNLSYIGEVVRSAGNKKLLISCRDSRGRESAAVETNTISFTTYTTPIVESISISKSERGFFVITSKWSYDTVGGRNKISGQVYYKTTSSEFWTPYGAIQNNVPLEMTGLRPDELSSYNFRVIATDSLGNASQKDSFSSTKKVLLDFKAGGGGLGVGKICETDAMEVGMDAKFFNDVYIRQSKIEDFVKEVVRQAYITPEYIGNMMYPIGSIYISLTNEDPMRLFGGSWVEISDRFLLAAGKVAAGSTGGEEQVTLTVDQIPSHNHWGATRAGYDQRPGSHPSALTGGDKTNSLETDYAGGGEPHNNMPPYLAVYMWRRVA